MNLKFCNKTIYLKNGFASLVVNVEKREQEYIREALGHKTDFQNCILNLAFGN